MFLTRKEIIELTGYKFRNMQIKWLLEHGYKFDVTAGGNPIVLIAHVLDRLGGTGYKPRKMQEPNLSNSAIFG
ncbi:MAG: DUF4224 domain-containing protein [Gammaproteobacteria bacterium]